MQTFHVDFTGGINVVGDKALLSEGFATILDGVDLRSGGIRGFNVPQLIEAASEETIRCLYEYHGRFFQSANWRDYVAYTINGQDIVAYTEDGQYPLLDIDGDTARLGIDAPKCAPIIVETTSVSPNLTLTINTTGGSFRSGTNMVYRVAKETEDGIQIPSGGAIANFTDPANTNSVVLTWSAGDGAIAYHIFAGPSGKEQFVAKVGPTTLTYTDDGTRSSSGDYASNYESFQPYQYFYTFVRRFGSVFDESGPSPLSRSMMTNIGRLITIDPIADGYFSGTNAVTISSGITFAPSTLSMKTITAVNSCMSVDGLEIVFSSPHALENGDLIRFPYTVDAAWAARDVEIIASSDDTSKLFVKNVTVPTDVTEMLASSPYVASVASTVTLATVPTNIIEDDTAVSLTLSKESVVTTACMRAKWITNSQFTVPLYTETGTTCTSIQYVPKNDYIVARNIYRSSSVGGFFLVKALDIWDTSFTDGLADYRLGAPPTSYYQEDGVIVINAPAPLGLKCITAHHGMLFGIHGRKVRWTPIGAPTAWPEIFYTDGFVGDPIALKSFGGTLIVLCDDAIYRIDGNQPTRMSLQGTHANDGCIAPHSVQSSTEAGLLYLSKRGVMSFDGMHAKCITDAKIPAQFFAGTSSPTYTNYTCIVPTLDSYNYAALAHNDGVLGSLTEAHRFYDTGGIDGVNYDIKSFIFNGKYFIFWGDTTDNYGSHTMLAIDLQMPGLPITTLPLKAHAVHVSATERVFAVVPTRPYMSVTMTYEIVPAPGPS